MGGLSLSSFCNGSKRFSKAFAFAVVKHLMIPEVNAPSSRCSSTLAVSSCSLHVRSQYTKCQDLRICCSPDEDGIQRRHLPEFVRKKGNIERETLVSPELPSSDFARIRHITKDG